VERQEAVHPAEMHRKNNLERKGRRFTPFLLPLTSILFMEKALPKNWKILSSTYLHKEPWLTVRKDELQMPSGHVVPDYFVLEYPDWINVIGLTREGKFLLVKQYRHAIGKESYELCAGVCDENDKSPLEAAKRELLEETGWGGGHWEKLMTMAPNPATSNNWVHSFIAYDIEKISEPSPEPSEHITFDFFSVTEMKEMVQAGEIIQGTHLGPLWKVFALNIVK
jgi:ADP-ribose pyrophosphatase